MSLKTDPTLIAHWNTLKTRRAAVICDDISLKPTSLIFIHSGRADPSCFL